MLIHPTGERLRALGLTAMAEALIELQNNPQAAEMPHADWLGLLIDREVTFRDNRRLAQAFQPRGRDPLGKPRTIALIVAPGEAVVPTFIDRGATPRQSTRPPSAGAPMRLLRGPTDA
jgi:hypothetical protein